MAASWGVLALVLGLIVPVSGLPQPIALAAPSTGTAPVTTTSTTTSPTTSTTTASSTAATTASTTSSTARSIAGTTSSPSGTTAAGLADLGRLDRLGFIRNQGQVNPAAQFYLRGPRSDLFFTSSGVVFALFGQTAGGMIEPKSQQRGAEPQAPPARNGWAVQLSFVGASPTVPAVGQQPRSSKVSYLAGSADQQHPDVGAFGQIVYPNLWPGIDLVYTEEPQRVKYAFEVHPSANPSQVQLLYQGASGVALGADGGVTVTTPIGSFEDEAPTASQQIGGQTVGVPVSFGLSGTQASFQLGAYDPTQPLEIDPSLAYSGALGGSDTDIGSAITIDSSGDAFIAGTTDAANMPTTPGVIQGSDSTGNFNAFVGEINPQGTGLDFLTYLGGASLTVGNGVGVDGSGNVYVDGNTLFSGFPTKNPIQACGSSSGFLTELNPTGTALVVSTCFGTSGATLNALAVDSAGNAYLAGQASGNAITPVNAFQPTNNGNANGNAIVAKINSAHTVAYATYPGGQQRLR